MRELLAFLIFLKNDPNFSLKLLQLTTKNWDYASRMVSDMAQKKAKQRLAEMLLWLKYTFGLYKQNCIDIKISREYIANMVGSVTEEKCLSSWTDSVDHRN